MRNLKKVLALVIAFAMMFSVVAFAGYNDVAADADYAGAVELLSALGIIKGDDQGNFNPDNTITRAEMAAIVCRAKGLENSANGAKGATSFTDVAADHWAAGYINLATQNGIINGYGNGLFGPEDTVTYEQAVAMLVRAIGFEPMAVNKGGFPTGYMVVANTYKITDGVAASVEAPRKSVAQLVYNTLSTPMMDQTTYGADAEFEILDGKKDRDYRTLLTDMDIYIATGIVGDKDVDEIGVIITEDSDDLEFEEGDEETFEINGTDIADYTYQNADVYVQKDKRNDYKVLAVVAGVIGETFAVLSDDVVGIEDGKLEYYVDSANSSKTKTIKVAAKDIAYNKASVYHHVEDAADDDVVAKYAENDDVQLVFIENTGDTTYDVLVATEYYSAMVDEANADRDRISIGGTTISFDFEDEDVDVVLCDEAGNELTLADFAEDDVVAVLHDGSKIEKPSTFDKYIKIIKLADSAVTGVVEETYTSNGDEYVVIDGSDYKVATDEELLVGDEGTFYVGMTGKIIVFDGSSVGVNYAYVLEAALSDSSFTADRWQIKLLTKDAGVVTYDVTDDMNEEFEKYLVAKNGFTVEDDATLWEDATAAEKANAARLITFKANTKGQIKDFEIASDKKGTSTVELSKDEHDYRADSQRIAGKTLEDDVVIFVVEDTDADDVYATDLTYLVDESKYDGYLFANDDKEYVAAVITAGDAMFDLENGFAVVTKKSDTKDAEDNDIVKLTVAQNEEVATIIVDEDSEVLGKLDTDDITVGSVLLYNADAEGLVTKYAVIASIVDVDEDKDDKVDYQTFEINKDALAFVEDDADEAGFYYGYIVTREKKNSRDIIDVNIDGDVVNFTVEASANQYTYNDAGRNVEIEIGDYLAEDVDEEVDGKVSFVLIRTFEDNVVDIYSANDRVELK